ncbi:zonadhesin-like [Branchiostoma floridae x Branchiostoma belcheri]
MAPTYGAVSPTGPVYYPNGVTFTCNSGFELNGTDVATCQADGTWSNPVPTCTQPRKAICYAWGDPHYTTFDGREHHFQGPCRYTFATDCKNSSDFRVEVQQVPFPSYPSVSIVREVYVMAYGYEIGILQGKVVTVKRPPSILPLIATPPFNLAMGKIKVPLSGRFVRVELTELSVVILYDGSHEVKVEIPSNYQHKMCGLCGNYNGMENDDFQMPNGHIASNWNDFGNSWETDTNACHGDPPTGPPPTEGPCDPNHSDPCDVLTESPGPFTTCHGAVDPQTYLETCVFDTCATRGQGLCHNLEAYYDSCADAGVSPFTWRTADLCPMGCPANSTYSSCTSACPATCVNPSASDNCTLSCVEGCECNPGYVQSGQECVLQADCGCTDGNGYYHMLGAVWDDNFEKCVCNAGNTIVCREPRKVDKAICSAWGDPHYTTLDGREHHFQGPCRYTFAKDCGNTSDFNVEVQQVPVTPTVSVVREVYVMSYGYEIGILQGKVVTVKEPSTMHTFATTLPFGLALGKIEVTLSGRFVRVELTELYVVILYDGSHEVKVEIPDKYRNRMCGLGGNYNGMENDDFQMPNGHIASNWNDFGNSWETDTNACHGDPPTGPPLTQEPCNQTYSDPCDVLTDSPGPFTPCHGVVDPRLYLRTCVFDTCATRGQEEYLCANLEAYYGSCRGAGVSPFTWRTSDLCPMDCPANSTYSPCTSACPATCVNSIASDNCTLPCVEGCECNPGYVLSGLDCVPEKDCGCASKNGYYYIPGTVWQYDGEECVCNTGGTAVCEVKVVVPRSAVAGASVGVAVLLILLIVAVVLVKTRGCLASGRKDLDNTEA